MLLANRRASRLSHCTGTGGYSKPAPGPLILKSVEMVLMLEWIVEVKTGLCSLMMDTKGRIFND